VKESFYQGLGIINTRPNEPGESIPISKNKLNNVLKKGIAQECSIVDTPIGPKVKCNKNV
jgi:hypothetical protein